MPSKRPFEFEDSLSPRAKAKLAALALKRARYVPWRIAQGDRAKRWTMQADLRKVLRKRTGRKWAVLLKRAARDADFTITFRAHWYRQPTAKERERVAFLLGKEWKRDGIGLSRAEVQAILAAATSG